MRTFPKIILVLPSNWKSILPAADAVDNSTVVLWSACFQDTDERYRNSRLPRPRARFRRIYFPSCRLRDIGRPYPVLSRPPRRRTCRPNPATSCCTSLLAAPVIIMQIRIHSCVIPYIWCSFLSSTLQYSKRNGRKKCHFKNFVDKKLALV